MKNTTLTLGPSVEPHAGEAPVGVMLWVAFDTGTAVFRAGALRQAGDWTVYTDKVKSMIPEGVRADATILAVALEPVYDHNGYYDPSGGLFTLDRYAEHLKEMAVKIGDLPPVFSHCPKCGMDYNRPVIRCSRGCGYRQ